MNRVWLLPLVFIAGSAYARDAADEIAKLRAETSKAIGTFPGKGEWIFSGTQAIHGSQQPFTMAINRDFRFRGGASGKMPEYQGFDGKSSWFMNGAGLPHSVGYSDRDLSRLDIYVLTGLWSVKDSPVEIILVNGDTCDIKCKDGEAKATLTLDNKTKLPQTMTYWGPSGVQKWTYSQFTKRHGVMVPTIAQRDSGDNHERITITTSDFRIDPKEDYQAPKITSDGFTYDPAIDPNVEVKRMFGYLFIKPLINGKDEGWFFLDTGAEVMVLDPSIAKKNGAETVGKEDVSGVVGSVTTDFVHGLNFQLGPATIKKSSYMLLDMEPFSKALGIKLAGICGFDFIGRIALDIDPTKTTIGVYEPGKAPLPTATDWTPFIFHGNIPSLVCQFEGDREGVFSLDTGSGSTVDFFSPIVKKYELLKDRKVVTTQTGGAGGSAESKAGSIEWFQLGPKRFMKPRVVFQIAEKGAFASPYEAGNIGMGFMSKFHMVLDYQNYRIAFKEKV